MAYTVIDGKIHTPGGCELNIVHHCNLQCRGCSHLSPTFHRSIVDPADIFTDLTMLAKTYRPQFVKLLGGEPLLHPQLTEVIDAIRASGITERIFICTNGVLLPRMGADFWERVNEIQISVYPGNALSDEDLVRIRHTAATHGVALTIRAFDRFRESYSEIGTTDTTLVRRVYTTCQIAHLWRCHMVFEGHFFKCPPSIFIPLVTQASRDAVFQNGIRIGDTPDFKETLLAYLESPEPLPACANCLGTAGKLFAHEQRDRRTWRAQQQYPVEDLIDYAALARLERDPAFYTLGAEQPIG